MKQSIAYFSSTTSFELSCKMLMHSSAQLSQAVAHSAQCSLLCLRHSASQASQILAQIRHSSFISSLPRLINWAAEKQTVAHSMLSWMHLAIILTSSSCAHEEAQWLQIAAQRRQASMQV